MGLILFLMLVIVGRVSTHEMGDYAGRMGGSAGRIGGSAGRMWWFGLAESYYFPTFAYDLVSCNSKLDCS